MRKPKNADDGMRGVADQSSYHTYGGVAARLAACNRALAREELRDHQTLRKAHLLRARASYHLRLDNAEDALADIRAARAAAPEYDGQFFYDRSMGVSYDLIEAVALARLDRWDEAAPLVELAAMQRPFAIQVQQTAAFLNSIYGEPSRDGDAVWAGLVSIDPDSRAIAERLRAQRSGVTEEDLGARLARLEQAGLAIPPPPEFGDDGVSDKAVQDLFGGWVEAYENGATLAFLRIAQGDIEQGAATLEHLRSELAAASSPDGEGNVDPSRILARLFADRLIEPHLILAESRLAVAEGRLERAAEMIVALEPRETPLTKELYAAFDAANAQRDLPLLPLPELRENAVPASMIAKLVPAMLIMPETDRALIDYKKSRTNVVSTVLSAGLSMGLSLLGGVDRTSGFESEQGEDGIITVKYTGNTISGPIVQEMTLLRAAEIAHESESTHFLIKERKDFQRHSVTYVNHVETGRSLAGYMTELDIRLLENGESAPEALEAVAVIEALGPVYYEEASGG